MDQQRNEIKTLCIKVITKSKNKGILNNDGEFYKIGLNSPPVDGKANEELIEFLSDYFKVGKSKIKIIRGITSRNKVVQIKG